MSEEKKLGINLATMINGYSSITTRLYAEQLAKIWAPSTEYMTEAERASHIEAMLRDLYLLARDDGHISVAWAFDFLERLGGRMIAQENRR